MSASNNIEKTPYGFKGEPARLIPCIADSHGQRVGQRTQISAWTEVVFPDQETRGKKDDNRRPDGAIVLRTGKREWKALIQAKVNICV